MEPALIEGYDENTYHADPAFSQSGAKLILDCPARYRHDMDNRVTKDEWDVGHAVHTKLLGVGAPIAIIPATSRAKADQEAHKAAKEEARENGHTPVTQQQADEIAAMCEAVLGHREARALLEREGKSEVSMWWEESITQGWDQVQVPCRGRIDRLTTHNDQPLAVDLKTTGKPTGPRSWVRSVLDYSYEMQTAAYSRGYEANTGQPLDMVHIAVEKTAPHIVAVYEPMPLEYVERGERRWLEACEIWARCTKQNDWPGHPGITTYPPLPAWAA